MVMLCAVSGQADATAFVFNESYAGGGNYSLVSGSDNPLASTLLPGDSFVWDVKAVQGDDWHVVTGGNFLFLQDFLVSPSATRTANLVFSLLNGGVQVLSVTQIGVTNQFVHMEYSLIHGP